MDQALKEMLKRDLFVQGLMLKWQEKVLPSATTFSDALHQARLAEDQDRQLQEMHKSSRPLERKKAPEKTTLPEEKGVEKNLRDLTSKDKKDTSRDGPRCYKCHSRQHKFAECPLRNRTSQETPSRGSTNSAVTILVKLILWKIDEGCFRKS